MISFQNILSEIKLNIYYCEVLCKTSKDENKVFIYNEIRGLKNVVVVEVEKNEYLNSQADEKTEYSLLKIKYISRDKPHDDINRIKLDAMSHSKIRGLLQFIPRFKTLKKIGEY
jgi:hypothetical protein